MLCGPAAESACSRSIKTGCRNSNVLQSPTRARPKSASDLRWIRVMEIQASFFPIASGPRLGPILWRFRLVLTVPSGSSSSARYRKNQ